MKTKIFAFIITFAFGMGVLKAGTEAFIGGQIITKQGDIIKGEILKRDVLSNSEKIHFKGLRGEVRAYKAKDIQAYQVGEVKYVSQLVKSSLGKKYVFLKKVHVGDTYLYVHYDKGGVFHKKGRPIYLTNGDYIIQGKKVNYEFYLQERGNAYLTKLSKKKFKKQLISHYDGSHMVTDLVTSKNFHYGKIVHLIDYMNQ